MDTYFKGIYTRMITPLPFRGTLVTLTTLYCFKIYLLFLNHIPQNIPNRKAAIITQRIATVNIFANFCIGAFTGFRINAMTCFFHLDA